MADYTLSARITGDASSFNKSMDNTISKLKETSKKVQNLGSKVSDVSKSIMSKGTGLTLGLTTPLVLGAKQAVNYASDLQEVQNVVDVTFGKSAKEIDKFAKTAGDSFGLSELQAKKFNGTLGAMLKSSGMTGDGVVDMSTDLVGLSADMASFYNLDHETAFDKIRAGISGETEPLKQLGINMSVANLEAYALAEGISKPFKEMSQGEQTQLRYGYLMQATSDAQGDFARTGDSHANMVKKMQLQLANISNVVGQLLLPYASKAVTVITDLMNRFAELSPNIQRTIVMGLGIVAALGPLLVIVGAVGSGIGTLITLFGLLISPVGLVLTAIVGLAAAFGYQMATNEGFRNSFFEVFNQIRDKVTSVINYIIPIVTGIWAKIQPVLTTVATAIPGLFSDASSKVASTFGTLAPRIKTIFTSVWETVQEAWGVIQPILSTIGNGIVRAFEIVGPQIIPILSSIGSGIVRAFEIVGPQVIPTLMNLGGQIANVFQTIWGILQAVWPIFESFFTGLMSGFKSATGAGSGFSVNLTTLLIGLNPIVKGVILLFQHFGPQIIETFQQISSMLAPVFGTIGQMIGQLATTIIPMVMAAVSSFIPIVMQLGSIIVSAVLTILPIVINLFNALVPIVMSLAQQIAQVIAVIIPLVANFVSALIPAISVLITNIMNIVTSVAPAFIAIVQAIGAGIQAILPIISSILQTVIHVMTNIISVVTPIIAFISSVIANVIAIIAPIVAFIAGIMTSIFSLIRPIITIVTGVFNTVTQVISSVWQGIMVFTGSVFASISTVISNLSGVVSGVFNTISGTISRIMSSVSNKITGVFDTIRNAWSGLTAFVGGIFSGISGSVSTLVGDVKGFVNGVIGGINSAVGLINKIPGVSISKIPMLARGTDDFAGGFARINEGGRGELVNMPGGTQVIPHDVSMRYAREAGKNSSVGTTSRDTSGGASNGRMERLLEQLVNKESNFYLDGDTLIGSTFDRYNQVGGNKTDNEERWDRA